MTRRWDRPPLALMLILSGYLLITLAYGVVNPLFEAPDEQWHYFTADYIAENGRLPIVEEKVDEWLGQEAAQPPLYYALGAALVAPLDTAGAREEVWLNPYAWIGDASAVANVNRVVHTAAEDWPWQGYVLAAHLLRILSTFFGLGTLLAIYGSGRLLWPHDPIPALLATGLVAFLPQFNFVHASVSNDTLITLLCSLALYQLLRLWTMNSEQLEVRNSQFIILGITMGLAILTKTAGLLLLLYTIGVLTLLAIRDGRPGQLARSLVLVIVPAVLIGGWLWWRNWSLYGDPTAANQFIRIAGGDRGYTLAQVLDESDGLLLSLAGVFGWFNVRPPDGTYLFWGGVALVAIIGLVYCAVVRSRQEDRPAHPKGFVAKVARQLGQPWVPALFLAGWVLAVYAGLLAFMMQTEAAQGRLLFPAVLPLALGAAYGLVGNGECARRGLPAIVRRVWGLPIVLALATTLYCLVFVIRPTYTRPALVEAIPESAWPVLPALADRGQGVHLLATAVESEEVEPGEMLWLTFYWRVDASLLPEQRTAAALANSAPEFVLELFGRDVTRVANLHSYHGRGLYPANLWPAGLLVADRFAVRLDEGMESPVLGRIFARLANGAPGIEVNTVKIVPASWPEPPLETIAQLGGSIELAEVQVRPEAGSAGDVVTITARWYVSGPAPGEEFTTLIHLGQPDAPPLATGDRPPVNGDYPTHVWEEGETIVDHYTLTIPDGLESGRYPLWIGMYDPRTGERLPLTVDGQPQPNNVYLAGWVEIQSE